MDCPFLVQIFSGLQAFGSNWVTVYALLDVRCYWSLFSASVKNTVICMDGLDRATIKQSNNHALGYNDTLQETRARSVYCGRLPLDYHFLQDL